MLPPRAALAMLLLAACAPMPAPQPPVTLPAAALPPGMGDPTRGAILAAAHVFARPATVAGNPAAAAEALAQLEYLAVELASGPRAIDMDALVAPMLAQGRNEARQAFGFDPAAPPQRAVDALYTTATALRANDRAGALAALTPLTGAGQAEGAMQRLAALPFLPRAAAATARARDSLNQRDRDPFRRRPL